MKINGKRKLIVSNCFKLFFKRNHQKVSLGLCIAIYKFARGRTFLKNSQERKNLTTTAM